MNETGKAAIAQAHEQFGTCEVKLIAWHNGDRSVGINGEQATVTLDIYQPNSAEGLEQISAAKDILARAFTELWDFRAHVMTEREAIRADDSDDENMEMGDATWCHDPDMGARG